MKIVDLDENLEAPFFCCLEEWSDEMKEAGDHKERWYRQVKDKGLCAKIAVDDDGCAVGMIQYIPVELSPADGEGLNFIMCIWVHGYKEGVGNRQKKGIGTALLAAAEQDSREKGRKGIAAWGLILPFWMKASWFRKHGYKKADRKGVASLLWKPFTEDAHPPSWIEKKRTPVENPGKVTVTVFLSGWCPAQNIVYERAKRAVESFNDQRIDFVSIDTNDRAVFLEWGISEALYIDGKEMQTGPPPKYEKIRTHIEKRLKRLD